MKFIIEMDVHETNKSIETGALLNLINSIEDSAAVEITQKPEATTAQPVSTQKPEATTITQGYAPTANSVPVVQSLWTHDRLAVAAMQLKDQGRIAELQTLLSQFGVASLVQIPKEQLSNFANALQNLGVKI